MSKYHEDEERLKRIKTGEDRMIQKAYQTLFKPFAAFLTKRYQCEWEKVKDIYPESFARFYFAIRDGKLAPPLGSSLQTYLNTVGNNCFIDRHYPKHRKHELSVADFPIQGEKPWVERKMESDANKHLLSKLLQRIDPKCRKLLINLFIKERPPKEIAKELNINRNTLRQQKFRCLSKLRKLMKG